MNFENYDEVRGFARKLFEENRLSVLKIMVATEVDDNIEDSNKEHYGYSNICRFVEKAYLESDIGFDLSNFVFFLNEEINDREQPELDDELADTAICRAREAN